MNKALISLIVVITTLEAIQINMKDFVVDYSEEYNAPTRVSYTLTKKQATCSSISQRLSYFKMIRLPNGHKSVSSSYYKYSGYDKGHLASDASFDCNMDQLRRTYTTVNVVPMKPSVNRVEWLSCERIERLLAVTFNEVVVDNLITFSNVRLNGIISIPNTITKVMRFTGSNGSLVDINCSVSQ